ncbi:GIY-YIG nuclease family protein [Adhaeribacter sp. BT258]|uniref:GIY-YIG nuclease family protein n=1 Tax=Adhaeribacter terrigena TaxID=2793070 RepID=A0ABS1BZG3_9BACT|nr:GIY-YIG nuclease family protein [Adhaeribacter terrigena]MBK0402536.1 GIY-YIG nuclease family protein [Adhaeribacter terrigena]
MATFGKSVRIYLKDGTVTGIKFGEVVNQTIQSISCPRLRTSELSSYSEAKRPGVYFLFGQDAETNEPKVYIGEAENVFDRLQSHIANKEFWNEVILFVSKDENLTKSHVKYLESRLIQIALTTKRYKVDNYNQSQLSSLPAADRDAMEEFLTYIKLLIGVLGHKLLEEITLIPAKKEEPFLMVEAGSESVSSPKMSLSNLELFLTVSNLKAKALQTEEGIVVLEGSEAAKEIKGSLSNGYKEQREKLINNGDLKLVGDKYIFQKNILFDTASPAASAVVGYSISGPLNWKDSSGKPLKEIEKLKLTSVE